MPFNEDTYEQSIIQLLEGLGYRHIYGPEVERDFSNVLYDDILEDQIRRINPHLAENGIVDALYKLRHFENGSLVQQNEVFMSYIQNGVPVSFRDKGEQKSDICYLVDYNNPDNNSFIVANQWTIVENSQKRPDIIIFINGIPVVLMELKSPARENTNTSEAYLQIRNYMHEIPSVFVYNAFLVMSDMLISKAGTITSDEERFMQWKSKDGNYETNAIAQFDVFFEGLFDRNRLLDIIKNFICFSGDGIKKAKILAGYHQYFAVRKAIEKTFRATETDGKGGVFWHTQGSGKSLSMMFYAHLLQEALANPTIVVITDRNDLDDQLFAQFKKCEGFLRQEPIQAKSGENLVSLLDGRKANGIFFTTIEKFTELGRPLSERKNIIVMADEAHRSQYGLVEKVVTKKNSNGEYEAKTKVGFARKLRNALPNATYIGFTGTPVSAKDHDTAQVFGDYIDIYDMSQAVADGATKPVYYESRAIQLHLDEETMAQLDALYDEMKEETSEEATAYSQRRFSKLEYILGSEQTVNSLVDDIITHYESYRADLLTGKAMVVAYSRAIAIDIYKRMLELRPAWKDKVKVIMTSGNQDPEDWREIIGNDARKQELAVEFKDNKSPFKIAIVVDMWLTGFDVPSLSTMYVFKPMSGHNLMQAIARVNRVFEDKEGGLVVDYIGIASALESAMKDYTSRDQQKYSNMNIAKTAYPKFQEKLQVCKDLIHGYNWSVFMEGTELQKATVITGAVNFLMDASREDVKKNYLKESQLLRNALSLCSSLAEQKERDEASFFEAVRVMIVRLETSVGPKGSGSPEEFNKQIQELLKQSSVYEGVKDIFEDKKIEFSLFDPHFLEQISKMKEKNIVMKILENLLKERISYYRKHNVVMCETFSEKLNVLMQNYTNGQIVNEEVIKLLLELAQEFKQAMDAGEELGLNSEEIAFYDALTRPENIKDFYSNDELVALTRELTAELKKNKTVDFQIRDDARARMKMLVRRLLKRHKYPPVGMESAVETVMLQCEIWADNEMTV